MLSTYLSSLPTRAIMNANIDEEGRGGRVWICTIHYILLWYLSFSILPQKYPQKYLDYLLPNISSNPQYNLNPELFPKRPHLLIETILKHYNV